MSLGSLDSVRSEAKQKQAAEASTVAMVSSRQTPRICAYAHKCEGHVTIT